MPRCCECGRCFRTAQCLRYNSKHDFYICRDCHGFTCDICLGPYVDEDANECLCSNFDYQLCDECLELPTAKLFYCHRCDDIFCYNCHRSCY